MAKAAKKGDQVNGTYSQEHNGHTPPGPVHNSGSSSGNIIQGSSDVIINGQGVVTKGDSVQLSDNCGPSVGTIDDSGCSSTVIINGKKAARVGSKVQTNYNSDIKISSNSNTVEIGD